MKATAYLVAAAITASSALAATDKSVEFPTGLKNLTNSDSYHMSTVRVVQARVQGDKPVWNADIGAFVSKYYTDATEAFVANMDTVNTASVEGALKYVQSECINYATRGTTKDEWCTRKNGVVYVVFYEMVMTQTNETLAQYDAEYGPFIAMDGGQCTATSGTGDSAIFPAECYYYNGTDGQPNLGPFVGGETRTTDARAPYPNTWWYSFPNSCPLKVWAGKTAECRASTRQGLCDLNTMPDGITCTYNYRILGWVPLDDLVGITAMKDPTTGETYGNFTQFCEAGNVEFNATTDGVWLDSIPFWEDPQNTTANAARSTKLVEMYADALSGDATLTQVTAADLANFKALPTIDELREVNPPCYKNVEQCATAKFGCSRDLYGQICTVCEAAADECVVAPSGFTFPTLTKATAAPSATLPPGVKSAASTSSGSSANATSSPSSASTTTKSAASRPVGLSAMASATIAVACVAAHHLLA